jgi:tRNA (pseudouridine54-N1)-methyltransferase
LKGTSKRCVRIPFPSDLPALPPLPRKNFLVVAHRARSDARFPLDDLCGASGRWDGLVRCITATLLISHGIRKDSAVHLVLNGPGDPPRTITVLGGEVKLLNPDERSTASLMRKALERPPPAMPSVLWAGHGIYVSRLGLGDILGSWNTATVLLDEKGLDASSEPAVLLPLDGTAPSLYILSDDQDLLPEESDLLRAHGVRPVSLTGTVLHSYQAITVCHFLLDRAGRAP